MLVLITLISVVMVVVTMTMLMMMIMIMGPSENGPVLVIPTLQHLNLRLCGPVTHRFIVFVEIIVSMLVDVAIIGVLIMISLG